MKRIQFIKVFLLTILFSDCSNNSVENKNQIIPLQKLSSEYTGIEFSNTISPNLETKENLFDYDYFYNGSRVAAKN